MMSADYQRGQRDCGIDIAASVLGALEPDEVRAFREHLVGCAACRDELAAFQGVADALPFASPQVALPRGLKKRVMSEIRKEPRAASDAVRRGSRRLPFTRPVAALGVPALAAAVVALLLALSGSGGTRLVQARVTAPGASAVVRLSGGQAALIVRRMPQPPAGKIYEVWLERGGAPPTPTDALFGVTSSGSASVAVPGSLHGATTVLVTPERRGGSALPTHAPVIVAQI